MGGGSGSRCLVEGERGLGWKVRQAPVVRGEEEDMDLLVERVQTWKSPGRAKGE